MMKFLGLGGGKKEQPADPNQGTVPSPYSCPFPLTGDVVENRGMLYNTANKLDCYNFRCLADSLEGFTLRYDQDGAMVWDRKLKGEPLLLIKTFGVLDIAPADMWDLLHDGEFRKIWDDSRMEGYRICLLNHTNDIGYYGAKVTKPIYNRDFVNQRSWHNFGNGEYVIFNTSVIHRDVPDQKGFVRANSHISGYLIQPWGTSGKQCSLTFLSQSDPKGWIPGYFLNLLSTRIGPSVLTKIRGASLNFPKWRADLGDKWFHDWETKEDPWNQPLSRVTQDFVINRMTSGATAPAPIIHETPVESPSSSESMDGNGFPCVENPDPAPQ